MENVLQHHGTKGMKWGKRLYQNKDGSLTPLGRVRYAGQQKKVAKQRVANLEKARQAKKTKEEEAKELEAKRVKLLKSSDPNELYKNRHLLSTAEINERLDRIDKEQKLASVAQSTRKSGRDRVNQLLAAANTANDVYKFTTESAIGKAALKAMGLDVKKAPSKEFNLDDVYKNMNKLSNQEVKEIAERVGNASKIEDAWKKAKNRTS